MRLPHAFSVFRKYHGVSGVVMALKFVCGYSAVECIFTPLPNLEYTRCVNLRSRIGNLVWNDPLRFPDEQRASRSDHFFGQLKKRCQETAFKAEINRN